MNQSSSSLPDGDTGSKIVFARSSSFAPFVRYLDNLGAPTDSWLEQAHMPRNQRQDPEGLLPLAAGYRFLELAALEGGHYDLGVNSARQTSVFELGTFGAALSGASTLHEYLELGTRHVSTLASGGTRFWLRNEGKHLRVHQQISGPFSLGAQIADVFTLVLTITTLQRIIGHYWMPDELCLRDRDERLLGDWPVAQSVAVHMGQPATSFTLPWSLLSRPVTERRTMRASLESTPLMPTDPLSSLEQLIKIMVASGITDIATTSETVGVSVRTLQRQLTQVGTSYRRLVGAAKLRLAEQWLTDTVMRVADIASELGYTDTSNFARAFHRQTGVSPLAYRLHNTRDLSQKELVP